MTETTHTPLPYYADSDGKSWHVYIDTIWQGEVRPLRVASNLTEEDATFIVLACNSHYVHKDALETLASLGGGRSEGNRIAQVALAKTSGAPT